MHPDCLFIVVFLRTALERPISAVSYYLALDRSLPLTLANPTATTMSCPPRPTTDVLAATQTSVPSTPSGKRGASDPVYLHFASFSQLSIHRTCTQQHQQHQQHQQFQDAAADECNGAEQFAELVRREVNRRRLVEQSIEFYHPHPFSASLLDAAYHSVVNATSRARSTNDAEFGRLREGAMQREKRRSTARLRTPLCPSASTSNSTTTKEWTSLVHLFAVAAPMSCPAVGSIEPKSASEVQQTLLRARLIP